MPLSFLWFLLLAVFNYDSTTAFIIFVIVALGCLVLFISNIVAGTFSDTVVINETGVYFNLRKKSLHLEWKHIIVIAITKYGLGKSNKRVEIGRAHV